MATVKKRPTLKIWADVIFALFIREIRSQFNDKFGISWSVISPLLFIIMLSAVRGLIDGGDTHGMPGVFFMMYGIVLVQFFIGVVSSVAKSIKSNKPLYAFRQVQPISAVIAIALLELLIKFFVILLLFALCFFAMFDIQIADPLNAILNVVKIWLIAISIGITFALGSCYIPEIDKIRNLAMRPIFFISGIFFSLQDIPREYWAYLNWNPLLQAVELTRYAAYPHYGDAGVSYFYLNMSTLVCVSVAIVLYHISWKQAISR